MSKKRLLIVASLSAVIAIPAYFAAGQTPDIAHQYELPNPALTPGAVSTMAENRICTARAVQRNSVNFFQKWKVHRAYKKAGESYLKHCQASGDCKIDHLISLN